MRTGILALAASAMIAGSAHATIYTQTFEGTVEGTDTLGYFGSTGATLNTTYTESFLVDTSKGTNTMTSTSDTQAGSVSGNAGDPVTATLLIAGISVAVGSTGFDGLSRLINTPDFAEILDSATDQNSGFQIMLDAQVANLVSSSGFPSLFGQAFNIDVDGFTDVAEYNNLFEISQVGEQAALEDLYLHPTLATEKSVSAAPEPSTWALMAAGVGLVGAVCRGRRRSVAVAA